MGVGGVKEKAVAAMRGGIHTVVLPMANMPELEVLPDEVRSSVVFLPVSIMDEVLAATLEARAEATRGLGRLPIEPGVSARLT